MAKKFKPFRMLFEIEGQMSSELIKSEKQYRKEVEGMFKGLDSNDELDGKTLEEAIESGSARWDEGSFQIEEE